MRRSEGGRGYARRNPFTLRSAHHHVFQPVRSIRHLLRDPTDVFVVAPSIPVGTEAQYRAIKCILRRPAMHQVSHVDDAIAEWVWWDWGGLCRRSLALDFFSLINPYTQP